MRLVVIQIKEGNRALMPKERSKVVIDAFRMSQRRSRQALIQPEPSQRRRGFLALGDLLSQLPRLKISPEVEDVQPTLRRPRPMPKERLG